MEKALLVLKIFDRKSENVMIRDRIMNEDDIFFHRFERFFTRNLLNFKDILL